MPDLVRRLVLQTADWDYSLGDAVRRELDSLGIREGEEFIIAHPDLLRVDRPQSAPHSNQTTSRKAALTVAPRAGSQRWRVLTAIFNAGETGITRDELEARLGLSGNTIRPRVRELLDGGFAKETDRTRRTRANADSIVLTCLAKGELALR